MIAFPRLPLPASPIYFQPLERELEPVVRYLSGHLLNAGCGTRDIAPFLRRNGVREITLFDIASDDPEVIIGPIESLPFEEGSFDSVLCNAVLEHVADPEAAMSELARVVRVGGHVVAAVPFLQPYHASPGDYQRYTADGLAQLGRRAGLEVVAILPVHTIAQTLGWIYWEYAREKGGWLRRGFAYALTYLATRLSNRTDAALQRNANTFQAVFRRVSPSESRVIGTQWRGKTLPAACTNVRTMLTPDELRLLHHLASRYYTGAGAIVDAGCFLGGSTVALADGLRANRVAPQTTKAIHSYDRFEIEEWTRDIYFGGRNAGESFRDEFDRNIAPYASMIEVHAGDIREHPWTGGPIELLFIDVAKHWSTCDWVTAEFFPHLIPGRSLVIQQDYLYHHWVAWLHITMELYADYFEYVCDTEVNSVVFRSTRSIPPDVLRRNTVAGLSLEEKRALMDRAADRFSGPKRDLLLSAKEHFLAMLQAS